MMRAYWDNVAEAYEGRVLSVFEHDFRSRVEVAIEEANDRLPQGRAADLGCGVGKFTAILARIFGEVEACDFSPTAIREARSRCQSTPGVRFHRLDLSCDPMPFEPVEVVLCVNVLIMPDLDERLRAWRCVSNQVALGGELILVVPALESVHMERYRAIESCLDEGMSCEEATRTSLPEAASAINLYQGIVPLDGLPTKHYFREELENILSDQGFVDLRFERLGFQSPGAGEPLPHWDWLVRARRG